MFDVKIVKNISIPLNEIDTIIIEKGDIWTIFAVNNNEFLCFNEKGNKWFKIPMDCCVPYNENWC